MIVQHYSFRCDVAGCETEAHDVTPTPTDSFRGAPPPPQLPQGWRLLGDALTGQELVCPKHELALDGRGVRQAFHPLPKEV